MNNRVINSVDEIRSIVGVRNDEKETSICIASEDKMATLFTNDNSMVTKMKKRFAKNTKDFTCIEFFNSKTNEVYSYKFTFPKKYVSIRAGSKSMSEESRKKASERFKKMWDKE